MNKPVHMVNINKYMVYLGVSENVVYPEKPNGFADHYPYEKWLAIIANINPTFSDNPKHYPLVMTNIAMERSTMLLIGKPSISIRAICTMAMLNNQKVHLFDLKIPRMET